MSEATMRTAVEFRLQQHLLNLSPPVQFDPENTKTTKPQTAYVEVDIMEGKSRRANLGGFRTVRYVGVVQIDVMYPKDSGMGAVTAIASSCGKLFDEWSTILPDDARLNFRTPVLKSLGNAAEHVVVAVSIPYWRDENTR